MRKMLLILTGVVCIVAVTVLPSPARAQGCGPGPHWIHDPPCDAGEDNMPYTRALVGVDLDFDCLVDANLILSGPVTVERLDPSDDSNRFPGTRPEDGHIDVIDTEILSMSLTGGGFTLVAGAGQGQGGVLDYSYGAVAELPTEPDSADSFFDVFFEIDMGGGMYLYNHDSLRIATVIDRSHRLVQDTSNPRDVFLSTQLMGLT